MLYTRKEASKLSFAYIESIQRLVRVCAEPILQVIHKRNASNLEGRSSLYAWKKYKVDLLESTEPMPIG